jgi:hypothetical protein
MNNAKWLNIGKSIYSSALAQNTWKKYAAALKKFKLFCHDLNINFCWPLSPKNLAGFVIWCKDKKCISAKSVESYLFGLSKLQQLNGFQPIELNKSIPKFLLNGWLNESKTKKRKDQTFSIQDLEILRTKFKKMFKHRVDSLAYTTAAVLAFLGALEFRKFCQFQKKNLINFQHSGGKISKLAANK